MKKHITLFILLALYGLGTATAQDTLSAVTLKPGYFVQQWPDFSGDTVFMNNMYHGSDFEKVYAKLFSQNDTLMVYGFAVGAETYDPTPFLASAWDSIGDSFYYYLDSSRYLNNLTKMCDTSDYEEAYELWGVYKRVSDSLQLISPQLPVNVKLQTPTYYLDFGSYRDPSCTAMTRPLSVYELYLHQSMVVSGDFYMGITNRNHELGQVRCKKEYYTWPVLVRLILPFDQMYREGSAFYQDDQWHFNPRRSGVTFIFPILTPPDSNYVWDSTTVGHDTTYLGDTLIVTDTVIVGGDTIITTDTILSIQNGTLLDRLTGVMPNPAVGTAKVVSSFGMSMVEAYDMSGTLVHRQRVNGLATTLDVRHWPTGTYLLRIHTPQGTAVKKLVVRR